MKSILLEIIEQEEAEQVCVNKLEKNNMDNLKSVPNEEHEEVIANDCSMQKRPD